MAPNLTTSCTLINDPLQLERLSPEWMSLLERSAVNEPTMSAAWLLTWWRVFGPLGGRQLRAATFREGGRLIGLAPLLIRRQLYRGHLPFRRLELLGTGENPEDEICSDYSNVIAERGKGDRVYNALVQALARGQFGNWDELIVPMADGAQETYKMLIGCFKGAGFLTKSQIVSAAPYITLPRSWDEYLGSLSSDNRYYVRRSIRDFRAWAGDDIELKCASTAEELEQGKRILMDLHQERWRSRGQPGVFTSPRFRQFHDRVLPQFLTEGALELLWLEVRGEPVAALYNIIWNGKVYSYQSGRRLNLPRGLRPGVVVHAMAIQRAIRMGLREYDFLAGVSRFKRTLALESRPLVHVRVARRSFMEYARMAMETGIARTRGLRRAMRRMCNPGGERTVIGPTGEAAYGAGD